MPATRAPAPSSPADRLPYAAAGLSAAQAAAHLLNRLAYGPRPGDVQRVIDQGLEAWVEQQLDAAQRDDALDARLREIDVWQMSAPEIARRHPHDGLRYRLAMRDGHLTAKERRTLSPQALRAKMRPYEERMGFRTRRQLIHDTLNQAFLRAAYGANQLREVLTAFWRNHFAISFRDQGALPYLLAYERDAIRPHVLGDFRTLLGATARHPAMLYYLDNRESEAPAGTPTTLKVRLAAEAEGNGARAERARMHLAALRERAHASEQPQGVNENYARELLELHTLGVDGGYTQADVEAVARIFTGWSVRPLGPSPSDLARLARTRARHGFVYDPTTDFYFRPFAHDATPKQALGLTFDAGGGIGEGERLLDYLATRPATARHLSRKLATHFVADDPPADVVDTMAHTFAATGGNLRAVMRRMVYHPAFWSQAAREGKVKDPLTYAVSMLRATGATLADDARAVWSLEGITRRMGQPLYRPPAPTGFPDTAAHWINTGTLLNRMNAAMQLAAGGLRGVTVDLLALNGGREPGSVDEALSTYAALLLPGRDADARRLRALATAPGAARRLGEAARAHTPADAAPMADAPMADAPMADAPMVEETTDGGMMDGGAQMDGGMMDGGAQMDGVMDDVEDVPPAAVDANGLAQVVGVLLGSPAFQRR